MDSHIADNYHKDHRMYKSRYRPYMERKPNRITLSYRVPIPPRIEMKMIDYRWKNLLEATNFDRLDHIFFNTNSDFDCNRSRCYNWVWFDNYIQQLNITRIFITIFPWDLTENQGLAIIFYIFIFNKIYLINFTLCRYIKYKHASHFILTMFPENKSI